MDFFFRMIAVNISETNMSHAEMLWSVGFCESNVWTEYLSWLKSLYWVPNAYQSYATGYVEEQLLVRLMILDAVAKRSGKPCLV